MSVNSLCDTDPDLPIFVTLVLCRSICCICRRTCVASALFKTHECVGNYTLPLDHSVLVRSDICQLGCHGESRDYVWRT